jgi:adenylate/nucleoside-diphosphate kinase
MGKAEFACSFAGRVFLFSSEENQKMFLSNPKFFLNLKPQMPKRYNLAIIG